MLQTFTDRIYRWATVGRHKSKTGAHRARFLAAIAAGVPVAAAAKTARVSRQLAWQWRQEDPTFASEFEAAYAAGTDVFEAEAIRRALAGSDRLLIFILQARDPARWGRGATNPATRIEGEVVFNSPVHFYLPSNGRDEPDPLLGHDSHQTIEGEVVPPAPPPPPAPVVATLRPIPPEPIPASWTAGLKRPRGRPRKTA
jgi:hypothetical protein